MNIVPPGKRHLRRVLGGSAGRIVTWAYIGQDPRPFHQTKAFIAGRAAFLDIGTQFQHAAAALREPYLTLLYDIGREVNTFRWWTSSISYRSGYHSTTFQQAAYLKVGLDLATNWQGPGSLLLVASDSAVRQAIRRNLATVDRNSEQGKISVYGATADPPWRLLWDTVRMLVHRAYFLLREGRRVVGCRRHFPAPGTARGASVVLFCRLNQSNFPRGEQFHTSFFGDLAAQVKKVGHSLAIVPLIAHGLSYQEALHQLKASDTDMLVPHRFIGLRDLIRGVLVTLNRPPLPRAIPRLSGLDISPLLKHERLSDWISNQAADAYLIGALIRKWADSGFSVGRAIYIYENQPWERAICWEARQSMPDTMLVGYQYGRVPHLLLNWYLAPGGEREAPLPHRVVTGGAYAARQISEGYKPGSLITGGALEMQDFLRLRKNGSAGEAQQNHSAPIAPVKKRPVVLVAPSIGPEEAAELVDMAGRIFNPEDDIDVIIRCHPTMPFERVRPLIDGPLPECVEVSDAPSSELMKQSSVMIYTSSTICVQALALGLPVVHLRTRFDLDMDPLEQTPDARLEATTSEELRERVLWVVEHKQEYVAEHREQWSRLVDDIYGPVTEQTYRAFLD